MGSEEDMIRSRKQALKPIETKIRNRSGKDHVHDQDQITTSTYLDEEMIMMEEEEPVSPAGRFFNEPKFRVHIISIIGCKTRICTDVIKERLPNTLLKHPRFSSLLVEEEVDGGIKLKWVRTKVDVDKHVIVPDIDPNVEMSPETFVEDYIYNLTKTCLDKSKPLWEIHIINLKTVEAEGVCVFRIHHSLGDGMSLMSLLLACTRQIANPEALPTLPVAKEKKKQDYEKNRRSGGFITSFSRSFIGVWWLVQLLWNTLVDVFLFLATGFFLRDTQTPIRAPPGREDNSRRIIFRTLSLDDFKLVKNAMNSTINDVALGVTQAGLSTYLNRRYGENKTNGGSTGNKNNLPKKVRFRSNLLVNIRPSPGIQDLADMMEKNSEAKWGNWIGYVILPLTIALKDDPLDYIRQVKLTVDRKKHSLEALCTFYISGLVFTLFGIKLMTALYHKILSGTTMGFSNVVGPTKEIGFYGHELAFLAATTYGQPHELMVNFQSYANKMTLVLSVDEASIPDSHQLCNDIVESLKLIKDAVIDRGLVK